jgi:pimeloyl-ACP methyl ester carboxylesterase
MIDKPNHLRQSMAKPEFHETVFHPTEGIDRFANVTDITAQQYEEEIWHHGDNILVASHIYQQDLKGYELNPVRQAVAHLGEVCLMDIRVTGGSKADQQERIHRLYTVERDGFRHAVEVTDPIVAEPAYAVFSYPGFTEQIEGGIRKYMHSSLAREFPEARIVSVGSNGIGSTGSRYGWNERSLHGLDAMGSQRLALAKALAGRLPVFVKGTSMGTVVSHRLAHQNFYGKPEDGEIDLRGLYWLSPALVDPKNVFKHMGLLFVPQLTTDAFKEIALKTPPREALNILAHGRHYGLSGADFRAMGHQMLELFQGTKEEAVGEVIAKVPTVVVAGENDGLAQWPMMDRLHRQYDGHLHLEKIKGRGHSLAMKPDRACAKLASTGRFLVDQAMNDKLFGPASA